MRTRNEQDGTNAAMKGDDAKDANESQAPESANEIRRRSTSHRPGVAKRISRRSTSQLVNETAIHVATTRPGVAKNKQDDDSRRNKRKIRRRFTSQQQIHKTTIHVAARYNKPARHNNKRRR